MAKKKKTGGRNPVEPAEKVILVGFYTKQKNVDKAGGMPRARNQAKTLFELGVHGLIVIKDKVAPPLV